MWVSVCWRFCVCGFELGVDCVYGVGVERVI